MNVRRRNQIVTAVAAVASGGTLLSGVWAMWQVEGRRGGWLFVVLGAGAMVFVGWSWWGARRDNRELDRFMESVGINPAWVPEEPVPIMPPRGQRGALALAIVFLLVVAAMVVGNYLGWLEGFSLSARPR